MKSVARDQPPGCPRSRINKAVVALTVYQPRSWEIAGTDGDLDGGRRAQAQPHGSPRPFFSQRVIVAPRVCTSTSFYSHYYELLPQIHSVCLTDN